MQSSMRWLGISPSNNSAHPGSFAVKVQMRLSALVLLTSLFFSIGPLTIDLTLPALPTLQAALGSPDVRIELTLTTVFFGMALSQFVFGAIADRYGRRPLLIAALLVYVAASLAATGADSMLQFGGARLLQALSYGVAIVLARSVVVDVCNERDAARVFSIAIMTMSMVSVGAPLVGAQLLERYGWQSAFHAMVVAGTLAVLCTLLLLPETASKERQSAGFGNALRAYGRLLGNQRFVTFAAIGACAVALQFTYNTGAPAVFIQHHGLTPSHAGLLLSIIALSMAFAAPVNALLLKWFAPERLMRAAVIVSVLASFAVLGVTFVDAGTIPFTAALFVLIAVPGFVAGNSMAGAISSAGSQAGAASGLVGVVQFLLGTIGSACVGALGDPSGRVMAVVLVLLSLGALTMTMRAQVSYERSSERMRHG